MGATVQSLQAEKQHMSSKDTPLVSMRGLSRRFPQGDHEITVLKDIDLTIEYGEFVAIQGTSGSGKSTLLQIMGLLDRPSSGDYFLEGRNVAHLDDTEASKVRGLVTGFVFQNFYLIPYATALENVLLPGLYTTQATRVLHKRAEELLQQVGLADRMDFLPAKLSGGQQQRVALARALLNNPALILADEPTGQLDSGTSKEILDLFSKINATGKTIVIVTHDADTASATRRRIEIRDGNIESDTPLG